MAKRLKDVKRLIANKKKQITATLTCFADECKNAPSLTCIESDTGWKCKDHCKCSTPFIKPAGICGVPINTGIGITVHCEKSNSHIHPDEGVPTWDQTEKLQHGVRGYYWQDGQFRPSEWTRSGLWLTSGGRIVKPSSGEQCSTKGGDVLLITTDELQTGVDLKRFMEYLERVVYTYKFGSSGNRKMDLREAMYELQTALDKVSTIRRYIHSLVDGSNK